MDATADLVAPRAAGTIQDTIQAAGTLPRTPAIAHPALGRRLRLVLEITVIFVLAPIAMRYAVYDLKVPLFVALPPVLIAVLLFLLADRTFLVRQEFSVASVRAKSLASVLALFLVTGAGVLWLVHEFMPDRFLVLPRERPDTWIKILCLYPFTSVLAQEFVYRSFFFHRYGPLFANRVWLMILANAVLFGLGHALFRNWIAVGGTFAAGLLFAWRYQTTRSFWVVWIEHTLWGWLVFTSGLGVFFFTGIRNPAW